MNGTLTGVYRLVRNNCPQPKEAHMYGKAQLIVGSVPKCYIYIYTYTHNTTKNGKIQLQIKQSFLNEFSLKSII